jgi:hypothetical protein
MATYVGTVTRADHESLPKKFLTAWINGSQKNGAPQLSCNNNFADAIHKILPPETLSNRNAPLREWKRVPGTSILTADTSSRAKNLTPPKMILTQKETA